MKLQLETAAAAAAGAAAQPSAEASKAPTATSTSSGLLGVLRGVLSAFTGGVSSNSTTTTNNNSSSTSSSGGSISSSGSSSSSSSSGGGGGAPSAAAPGPPSVPNFNLGSSITISSGAVPSSQRQLGSDTGLTGCLSPPSTPAEASFRALLSGLTSCTRDALFHDTLYRWLLQIGEVDVLTQPGVLHLQGPTASSPSYLESFLATRAADADLLFAFYCGHKRLKEAALLQRKLSCAVGGGGGGGSASASAAALSSSLAASLAGAGTAAPGANFNFGAGATGALGAATSRADVDRLAQSMQQTQSGQSHTQTNFNLGRSGAMATGAGTVSALQLVNAVCAATLPEPLQKRIERLELALALARDPAMRHSGVVAASTNGPTASSSFNLGGGGAPSFGDGGGNFNLGAVGGGISRVEQAVWTADLNIMRLQRDVCSALKIKRTASASTAVAAQAQSQNHQNASRGAGLALEASFIGDNDEAAAAAAAASLATAEVEALDAAIHDLAWGPVLNLTLLYRGYAKRFEAHDVAIAILDAGGECFACIMIFCICIAMLDAGSKFSREYCHSGRILYAVFILCMHLVGYSFCDYIRLSARTQSQLQLELTPPAGRKASHAPLALEHWRALIADKLQFVSDEVLARSSASATATRGVDGDGAPIQFDAAASSNGPYAAIALLKQALGDLGRRLVASSSTSTSGAAGGATSTSGGAQDVFSFTFPVRFIAQLLEQQAVNDRWSECLAPGYPYGECSKLRLDRSLVGHIFTQLIEKPTPCSTSSLLTPSYLFRVKKHSHSSRILLYLNTVRCLSISQQLVCLL